MTTITKKQKWMGGILILSTLLFPIQYLGLVLLGIPCIYISLIVPYYLWKILCGGQFKNIKKAALVWKIPVVLALAVSLIESEMLIASGMVSGAGLLNFNFSAAGISFVLLPLFLLSILVLRIIVYGMMIFIWQPQTLKISTIIIDAIIFLYGGWGIWITFIVLMVAENL